jgi:hypothetical protein
MHTWTQDFSTTRKVYRDSNWHGFNISLRPKKYQDFIGKIDLDKIKKVIPHSSVLLENFNEDSICSEFQIPYKHETKIYQNILNSIAMYVGISKSFNLARLDPDFENYTHFARIRILYWRNLSRQRCFYQIFISVGLAWILAQGMFQISYSL